MRIGIILYSQTGNTRTVAEVLKEKLLSRGHTAEIDEIKVEGEPKPGEKEIAFSQVPDVTAYDAVVLAAQVQAFSLSMVMKAFLEKMGSLEGKKAALLVSKHLAGNWTGGNGAIRTMKKAAAGRGAEVVEKGIIIWSSKTRDALIEEVTDRISRAF
jgi:flavodoxin